MELMLEILDKCLKDSNLETISKAELRKKYLEKTGLSKLPKEDKELFTSAVNTAFLNFISNKTKAVSNANIEETIDNEMKESGEVGEFIADSSSDEDITSANINENVLADQFENRVNNFQLEAASDSDEMSLASYKNNIIKKSSNDFKKRRGKRTLSSSSEDETFQNNLTKRSKVFKKSREFSDSEAEFIIKSEEEQKISSCTKSKNCLKKAKMVSSDSEDKPLTVFRKKSGSSNSMSKSDLSENESLFKFSKKQNSNSMNSDDEPVMPSARKKTNSINGSKNISSDSEDEPISKFQKSRDSTNLNGERKKFKAQQKLDSSDGFMKLKKNSSDSEDEPLTKYKKCNDSINSDEKSNSSIEKLNSSNKSVKSTENITESDDEPVLTLTRKKSNLLNESCISKISSSESENESLTKYSKRKVNNFVDSDDDLATTVTKEANAMSDSLKLVKNLSDSEDEPLNKLSNKKIGSSSDSENETVKKIVKGKVKYSLKNTITNGNKSKEQTLKKKKKFLDSDNDDNNISKQKIKSFNGKKTTLLSDSSENEPLTNLKNKESNSSDSEDEPNDKLSNKTDNSSDYEKEPVKRFVKKVKCALKTPKTNIKPKEQTLSKNIKKIDDKEEKEKFLDGQNNSLSSDTSDDEPLSNMTKNEAKNSGDSENEPSKKMSAKKFDKKHKSSESGSNSCVDENEVHAGKKSKLPKKKEASDSRKGKERLSASENKIEHLKKYVRVAGIRIQNYNKLFENCKTMKAKCEKLMSLLEKEGLKGRPTLEKCKKLKKKIETKKEIAELDLSNILKEGGGRPKRSVCSDTTNCKPEGVNSAPIKKFSRLQDIFDSEESD